MNNSNDSIDAELATLDKLLELSTNTAAEKNNSLLKKPWAVAIWRQKGQRKENCLKLNAVLQAKWIRRSPSLIRPSLKSIRSTTRPVRQHGTRQNEL